MTQEALDYLAVFIAVALLQHNVEALVVVIPGDGRLYGTATIFTDLQSGITALGLLEGVMIRCPHPQLGLVTFDYVSQEVAKG